MIDESAIKKIADLGLEAGAKDWQVDGETFVATPGGPQRLSYEPVPNTVLTGSLMGLVEYAQSEAPAGSFLSVESPHMVKLVGPRDEKTKKHHALAACSHNFSLAIDDPHGGGPYNTWMDQEAMLILLQSKFVSNAGDWAWVMETVGTMRDQQEASLEDNGITQQVATKAGVALGGSTTIKNPVKLALRGYFADIEQPVAPHVLRVRKGGGNPTLMLAPADVGGTELEAISRVRAFLKQHMGEVPVV